MCDRGRSTAQALAHLVRSAPTPRRWHEEPASGAPDDRDSAYHCGRLTTAGRRTQESPARRFARGARRSSGRRYFESALISMAIGLSPFRLKDAFTSWPGFS